MLNRRHLRIKALQTLYAFYQSETKDIQVFEKSLLQSVSNVTEAYLTALNLTIEVAEHVLVDAEERAVKHLQTEEDQNVDTRLAYNPIIVALKSFPSLVEESKKLKISFTNDSETIRSLYRGLIATEEYAAYIAAEEPDHRAILQFFGKKIMAKSPLFEEMMEARFLSWPIDEDAVMSMVHKTLKEFGNERQRLAPISVNWLDDRSFMIDLFKLTVRNSKDFQDRITDKTQNWDPERIAFMDTILMKMAMTELTSFKEIPVKVSINEYIELSKEYSTPKSKLFINGVLDKILVDLKAESLIYKTGRGLTE